MERIALFSELHLVDRLNTSNHQTWAETMGRLTARAEANPVGYYQPGHHGTSWDAYSSTGKVTGFDDGSSIAHWAE